ncbi:MAG: DEAD/DEAH box helicase [Azoarcus sp.]|jgi:ATP-dependent RNA helicase RhlE|nr:DEAD/DEAH box helicase [Azoarcus sp.]
MSFAELGLIPELLKAVADAGYTEPTPIQQQAIPVILGGLDVMGGAQTGTGKTAGFTLPLLQRLARHANTSASPARHPVRALILAPTRELAMQVFESVTVYGRHLSLRAACIFGGVDMNAQIQELRRGAEIVIATPGRLLDHVQQKTIHFPQVEVLVLDEADRMLDMGFIPDIRRILEMLPTNRQSLLFSATFSEEIRKLADRMLKNPKLIEVARRNTVSETITHVVHPVSTGMKRNLLAHLLRHQPGMQVLVFVDTKIACGRLAHFLARNGISADAIHGDKSQQQRIETLDSFKEGRVRVLVATDVAARGLDIDELPCVINFELPHTAEDYVHRIGRTGRAGNKGRAVSLVSPEEKYWLTEIQKLIKFEIPREAVPGFDPEAGSSGEDSAARGASHARRGEEAHAGRESGRKSKSAKRERSPQAVPSSIIAADDFDFSKPYEPSGSLVPQEEGLPARAATAPPVKPQRPLAALLGGLGRK